MAPSKHVEVHVELDSTTTLAGRLWSHRRRGAESATFSYDSGYLATAGAYELDPGLPLVEGQQQTPVDRSMFGAFTDSAPDRWGRRLIERAEARRARDAGETGRSFGEHDFLLGVRDDLRQGALRFRDPAGGAFLADDESGVPALVDLPVLLNASDRLAREDERDEDLAALLRGGSSLGGARPKAHVVDNRGNISIAKFPSPSTDDWDVIRWEAVSLSLARAAGIAVSDHQLHEIDGRAVLIVRRFDRSDGARVGYVSAMTMLGLGDRERGSYLEIADVIEEQSPRAADDLRELWRRIAFSIAISNTDDHLRNHGFLRLSTAGWSLAPAFDLNPNPEPGPKLLSTAIDFDDSDARFDTLLAVAGRFRLHADEAAAVIAEVLGAVGEWKDVARNVGLDAAAIERMTLAFEHQQIAQVQSLIG